MTCMHYCHQTVQHVFNRTCSPVILAQSFINACTVTDQNITLNSSFHLLFWGVNTKMWRFVMGAAPPPPHKKQKLDSTEKRESDKLYEPLRGQQASMYFHPILDK